MGLDFTLPPISLSIWDAKYRFKEFDGTPIDESLEATWRRVAGALSEGEIVFAGPDAPVTDDMAAAVKKRRFDEFFSVMDQGYFSPAGRIISGAGTGRNVTLSNCFTMGSIPDSMDGIFSHLKEAALTMQQGGGIGYDFSTIRPKGAEVKGVAADASGPLTFMDVWDAMCRTVMSAGSRRGAMMATMRCDHPDIEAFIDAKKDPAKLRMFNLSVLVTDAFMSAVTKGEPWRLHFENRRGETISEKTVDARELWNKIMRNTYAFAEPGVIFIDRVNEDHNLGYLETIATTNPCGEKPMGPYASCLLGSINLARLVRDPFGKRARIDSEKLRAVVETAIRMMDNVIEVGNFPLPQQAQKAKDDRQLGLGVTGLADALIMCGLTYGSPEAVAWTDSVMKSLTIDAYRASVQLAKERGSFPTLKIEEFLKPTRFAGRMLPEWLKDDIRRHGIRNGLLISIAPTGTISLLAGNVSSGIEPVFAYHYTRKVLQKDGSHTEEEVEDFAYAAYRSLFNSNLENDPEEWSDSLLPGYFVNAQTLPPEAHVRMQAAAQRWVDSSISKTVNVPEDISFEGFRAIYELAYDSGCKGCTTYRPNEVTGSILSVKEEPKSTSAAEMTIEDLKRITNGWLQTQDPAEKESRRNGLTEWLAKYDLLNVSSAPKRLWSDLLSFQSSFPAADDSKSLVRSRNSAYTMDVAIHDASGKLLYGFEAADVKTELWPNDTGESVSIVLPEGMGLVALSEDAPQERPKELPATVHKLKWPGSDHAVYVTITDIEDPKTGQRRPFEVFINSKNMEHFAWTVALTRMISAIFRRPHDSRFVVDELKAVFDPKGGAWMEGKYVPSVLAAIGNVIETHMKAIGYIPTFASAAAVGAPQDYMDKAQLAALGAARTGPACASCGSTNVKAESGCFQCLDCGHSKCG